MFVYHLSALGYEAGDCVAKRFSTAMLHDSAPHRCVVCDSRAESGIKQCLE